MSPEGPLILWAAELMSKEDMNEAKTRAYSEDTCDFQFSIAQVLQVTFKRYYSGVRHCENDT